MILDNIKSFISILKSAKYIVRNLFERNFIIISSDPEIIRFNNTLKPLINRVSIEKHFKISKFKYPTVFKIPISFILSRIDSKVFEIILNIEIINVSDKSKKPIIFI